MHVPRPTDRVVHYCCCWIQSTWCSKSEERHKEISETALIQTNSKHAAKLHLVFEPLVFAMTPPHTYRCSNFKDTLRTCITVFHRYCSCTARESIVLYFHCERKCAAIARRRGNSTSQRERDACRSVCAALPIVHVKLVSRTFYTRSSNHHYGRRAVRGRSPRNLNRYAV